MQLAFHMVIKQIRRWELTASNFKRKVKSFYEKKISRQFKYTVNAASKHVIFLNVKDKN